VSRTITAPGLLATSTHSPPFGQWNNDQAYYLCRFPAEYVLANRIDHPKNVYLKEVGVLGRVGDWIAQLFASDGIDATVSRITEQAAQLEDPAASTRAEAAHARIAETQAKKVAAQAGIRRANGRHHVGQEEIAAVVTAFGDLARIVQNADPQDKADMYAQVKLTPTYQPGERPVQAQTPDPESCASQRRLLLTERDHQP
jgi:site-specific DNA recombinase